MHARQLSGTFVKGVILALQNDICAGRGLAGCRSSLLQANTPQVVLLYCYMPKSMHGGSGQV